MARQNGRARPASDNSCIRAFNVPIRDLNPSQARTRSLASLSRKVSRAQFAQPVAADATLRTFLASLPDVLAAHDLLQLAHCIGAARRTGRLCLLMMGAHPLKVGLGPLICDLIREGVFNALATNGAAMIHDFELAFAGRTSEDVGAGLADGSFGMAEETGNFLNNAAKTAAQEGRGLGEVVGREIAQGRLKFTGDSIFACAYQAGIPATVHVTLGADIIHMHPNADGAAIGAATMADFHRMVSVVGGLSRGVVVNLGSAVVMPEVFLKALNLARNLGRNVSGFSAADMDFIRQYRPRLNVVERPTREGGRGFALTGHHEIMFPLLAATIRVELDRHLRSHLTASRQQKPNHARH
jgi:deoxyhypusine synthase